MNDELEVVREFGRKMAARRRQVEVRCELCGAPIIGTTRRRFCSDHCRAKAHYRARTSSASVTPDTPEPPSDEG